MINPYEAPGDIAIQRSLDGFDFPLREQTAITPEVLVEGYFVMQGGVSSFIRIVAFSVGVVALLASLAVVILRDAGLPNSRAPLTQLIVIFLIFTVSGAFLILWASIGKSWSRWSLHRKFARDPNAIGWAEYQFTPEELVVRNSGDGHQIKWSQISKWRGSDGVVIAVFQPAGLVEPMRYLVFPTRSFSAETNDFLGLVRSH